MKNKKIVEEYIREILQSNALTNSGASCDGIPLDGNLLESTKFGPLYPNASEFVDLFMFIEDCLSLMLLFRACIH